MIHDWLEMEFLQRALLGGCLVAAACGLLSPYIVLRRLAFAGHGLAHAAFGGAGIALLLGISVTLGGSIFAFLLGIALALWTRRNQATEDSAIGILVAASMAIGVICLALRRSYTQDIFSFLFGNILAVFPGDLIYMSAVASVTLLTLSWTGRGLASATFHEELARVEGVPVDRLRVILFALIALNVVAAMKLVGAILVSALLVVPGATALFLVPRFIRAQILSLFIGVGSVVLGMFLSYLLDLPSGAAIALLLFLAYGLVRLVRAIVPHRAGRPA